MRKLVKHSEALYVVAIGPGPEYTHYLQETDVNGDFKAHWTTHLSLAQVFTDVEAVKAIQKLNPVFLRGEGRACICEVEDVNIPASQHSPGPWETTANAAGGWAVCGPDAGDLIAELEGTENGEANARFIAQAPELEADCKEMFQYLEHLRRAAWLGSEESRQVLIPITGTSLAVLRELVARMQVNSFKRG